MKINDRANALHGHVQVFVRNKKTGEKKLWSESDNVITLTGYQNILLRSFGLRLDSLHKVSYIDSNIGRDTNLVTPDLNDQSVFGIGRKIDEYSPMVDEFSNTHFIQGFMVGNQGAGEDNITTKNTNYSFINLRNPIPFRQTSDALNPEIANKYLGIYNIPNASELTGFAKSYYIKKFDETPHMYHTWWEENQEWDKVDPVTVDQLGPDNSTAAKTDRIASYIQCEMSIDSDDCVSYFSHAGATQSPVINELGLVSYNTIPGLRSVYEATYTAYIKDFIRLIFTNNITDDEKQEIIQLASAIYEILTAEEGNITTYGQANINNFVALVTEIGAIEDPTLMDIQSYRDRLGASDNIEVEAFYNQMNVFQYETDKFLTYLSGSEFTGLSTDEAERIKLVTYYTFNSIPLSSEVDILISYRIYTN
jgi:hypothetical protein